MQNQALPSSDCHSGFVSSIVDGSLELFPAGSNNVASFTPGLCKKSQLLCRRCWTKEGHSFVQDCILEDCDVSRAWTKLGA